MPITPPKSSDLQNKTQQKKLKNIFQKAKKIAQNMIDGVNLHDDNSAFSKTAVGAAARKVLFFNKDRRGGR